MKVFDCIIIGVSGAHGSSTFRNISQKSKSVLGIDQYTGPHNLGSSHGDSRIIRQAIGEGEEYVRFALRSYEIWRDLEKQTGEDLLTITGGLIIADSSKSSIMHGSPTFLENTMKTAAKHRIGHDMYNAEQARKIFPEFNIRDTELAYYEPGAGFLRPEKCIAVNLQLGQQYGGELMFTQVQGFEQCGELMKVQTNEGEFFAQNVVVTAGPWIKNFLAEKDKDLFAVRRQVMFWFDVASNFENFAIGRFPVFIWEMSDGKEGMYGFPAMDGSIGGVKIATEQFKTQTSPDTLNREVSNEEIEEMYENFASKYFPNLSNHCVKAVACMYTMTPDFGFIIDKHPDFPQVIIASPCSGHGFKHSAAIGEALAEIVIDGKSRLDISPFRFDRFVPKAAQVSQTLL